MMLEHRERPASLAIRDIAAGEEILEDYVEFDAVYSDYGAELSDEERFEE
jgi:hypothetical protein